MLYRGNNKCIKRGSYDVKLLKSSKVRGKESGTREGRCTSLFFMFFFVFYVVFYAFSLFFIFLFFLFFLFYLFFLFFQNFTSTLTKKTNKTKKWLSPPHNFYSMCPTSSSIKTIDFGHTWFLIFHPQPNRWEHFRLPETQVHLIVMPGACAPGCQVT